MISMDWMDQGLCRTSGADSKLFFPTDNDRASINAARKICFRCSVRTECLEFCLKHDERGIWGGTTEYERMTLRKRGAA